MWTSRLCNHTPEHHSPLSSWPDIVVPAVGSLRGSDRQHPAAAALDVDRQRPESPILNRTRGRNSAGSTRQRLPPAPPPLRSHPPSRVPVLPRSTARMRVDISYFRALA